MTRLLIVALLALLPLRAIAHEFWIEPLAWQVAPGAPLQAHIRVGQNMEGAPLSYIPFRARRFDVLGPSGAQEAGLKIGDRPALNTVAGDAGLYLVAHVTGDNDLLYREFDLFAAFVEHKDLQGTLDRHAERGLPADGFRERYSRYAKSLIAVGTGQGSDRTLGLLTEITALANPYTDDISDGLPVLLAYQDQPRVDAQIEIFERDAEGFVSVRTTRTDASGRALINVRAGHDYMLDAVVMREVEPDNDDGPVWESLWANLTFHVPAR